MSKVYKIEIEEILQKIVKIKANSLDEAISIVQDKYNKEEYILNEDNFVGVKFNEYTGESIKYKNNKEIER